MKWIRAIQGAMRDKNIAPSENVELFLQLDEDDEDSCGYYFVDHTSRTEFWLEPLSSESVDIPASASPAQMSKFCFYVPEQAGVELFSEWAFQEHYWMHVEYFPMHIGVVASTAIPELISILLHARGGKQNQ